MPAGQALKPAHHLARQRASAVESSGLITPEGREQIRVTAIRQVRTAEERHQLADHEVAHADAVCLGEAADVAGQAFGFRGADADRLEGVQTATRRDRRPRKLPLGVDRESVSAYRRPTPLLPDPVSDVGRSAQFGAAVGLRPA